MDLTSESLDKIRQQFDLAPYPRVPLETSPKGNDSLLFVHSLVTAHYLRHQRVISPENRLILDAGCGSGYKCLILAEANPGARIIGIDISEQSIQLSRQRLKYHQFENVEFHTMAIEDLPAMGLQFDYINCDEVLYLLPNPPEALQMMKSVLKPDGVLRTNLHNAYQRGNYYRAQALFKLLGLMDENPGDLEMDIVMETMRSLKDTTKLKAETWHPIYERDGKEGTLVDFLLLGDRGFTIPELFELLDGAGLEFMRMLNWRNWDVADLFKEPENLPAFWGMNLAAASEREQLRMYELLNPMSRLMDFWCALPRQEAAPTLVEEWDETTWNSARVSLHPLLQVPKVKADLEQAIAAHKPFEISRYIELPALQPVPLDSTLASALLPLWEGSQSLLTLAKRYQQVRPLHPATLEPLSIEAAIATIRDLLNRLDAFLYVLLEAA